MTVAIIATGFIGAIGLIEAKNNQKHILSVLVFFLFLLLLMGGNCDNADYLNYQVKYQMTTNIEDIKSSYWAYFFSLFFFNQCGVSFVAYHFFIYGLGLFFIFLLMRKTTKWSLLFLILYCIYPMMMDPTQMKNFVAMTIFSYAVTFLVESSRKNDLKYILFLILSAGFHIVFLIYLPLLLFRKIIDLKYFTPILISGIFILSVLFSYTSLNSALMGTMKSLIADDISDKEAYFIQGVHWGYLPYLMANIIICINANYLRKKAKVSDVLTLYQKKFLDVCFLISVYAFLFVPFYQFTLDFARFFRDLFLIIHAGIVLGLQALSVSSQRFVISIKQSTVLSIYILILIVLFGWDIFRVYDTVVYPLFHSNVLF